MSAYGEQETGTRLSLSLYHHLYHTARWLLHFCQSINASYQRRAREATASEVILPTPAGEAGDPRKPKAYSRPRLSMRSSLLYSAYLPPSWLV